MLAHVRHLASDASGQVSDRALAAIGEELEDAQPFRVRQGTGDNRGAVMSCLGGKGSGHHWVTVSVFAQSRKYPGATASPVLAFASHAFVVTGRGEHAYRGTTKQCDMRPCSLRQPSDEAWIRYCDTRGVVEGRDPSRMTVHLICPWCNDEVAFEVDRDSDELLCSACGTSFDFAPDPAVTYALLYEAA